MNTIEKVIRGRVRLLFESIFFGQIMSAQKLVEAPDLPGKTMAVDGRCLYFHPEFVEKITKLEMEGVLVHEVLHLVLLHHLRRGNRDPKVWNYSGDFVVNLIITAEGFILPGNPLLDQKYKGWTTEKVYDYLIANPDEQPETGDEGGCGEVMDAGTGGEKGEGDGQPMTAAEMSVEVHKVKAQVQAAAQAARKRGKLPGSIEQLINEICSPRANWKTILQRFVSEKAFVDFDFSQCNTRILHQTGIITPVMDGEALGKLGLIIDVSGSTSSAKQREQFFGEISDVLENYQCEVTAIYCDTRVTNVEVFTQDDLPLQPCAGKSGGGTVMKPGFDWIEENLDDCAAIILFSDGGVFDWKWIDEPKQPCLMACTQIAPRDTPEWIEVIDVSE